MAVAASFPSMATPAPRIIETAVGFDLHTADRVVKDVNPRIHALEELSVNAPVMALTQRMGPPIPKRLPIFYMFQLSNLAVFVQAAATFTSGDATITFAAADVAKFKQGYHIMNTHTREIMRVNSTPAASMPVKRSVGTVAAAANSTATDEFVILGYAGAEGDTRHMGVLRQPSMIFNYNGEWQDSYEVTQYAEPTPLSDGATTIGDARMDKLEQGRMTIELKSLFDQRARYINENNKLVYVPNGLDAICTENEYDFGGSMTMPKILTSAQSIARYGPSTRWVLASPRMMRKINELVWTTNHIRYDGAKSPRFAGVNVTEIQAGNLKLNIIPHLLLQDSTETDANALSGTAYVSNFERGGKAPGFAVTTMRGKLNGFFKWFFNLQTDGARKIVDQLVVNYGFTYTFAEHFARWINPGA